MAGKRKHAGIITRGSWGLFYPGCTCGWRRADGFASEDVAVSIAEQHIAEAAAQANAST